MAAGTHRPNIYNSEYLRVPWGGTLDILIKYMYNFSPFFLFSL